MILTRFVAFLNGTSISLDCKRSTKAQQCLPDVGKWLFKASGAAGVIKSVIYFIEMLQRCHSNLWRIAYNQLLIFDGQSQISKVKGNRGISSYLEIEDVWLSIAFEKTRNFSAQLTQNECIHHHDTFTDTIRWIYNWPIWYAPNPLYLNAHLSVRVIQQPQIKYPPVANYRKRSNKAALRMIV
ncbi:hypothetical protein EGR_04331 [Echinococcus granulosus]|uniref:Uncharacterized protein n=1 Tax=Echinococcus granulosus TaxID=6210 RepID=W6URD6_ECHGR|nr:hypothetical protein EGR_04331 [Echinococcus granulosus]EUB60892.1 hypothetical protein EGR_04331 [Echinococcus granulosus]